jgi:hypothetical protein
MRSSAVILMPSFGTDPDRLANQEFVIQHYQDRWGLPTVLGSDVRDAQGRFGRARAVNNAARAAVREHPRARAFVIADNDLIPDPKFFDLALSSVHEHAAIAPHNVTQALTRDATASYKRDGIVRAHKPYTIGPLSYVVISVRNYELVNGMDEAFRGWGGEDGAFIASIDKQLGPVLRLEGRRVHLWHPSDPTIADAQNRARNRMRRNLYQKCSPDMVRRLAREYGSLNLRG